jgi:hypothetical protein
MKLQSLSLVFTLVLLLAATAILAQPAGYPGEAYAAATDFTAGQAQGKADANGNWLYGCGGFACGPIGVLAAALSHPQPDQYVVNNLAQTRGADYVAGYSAAYVKEAKKKNITYSVIGMAVSVGISLIYYIASPSTFNYKEFDEGAPLPQDRPLAPVGISF